MFEQLWALVNRAVSFVPRFIIIEPDEQGVHIRCGSPIRTLDNGLWWYWPLIDSVQTVTTSLRIVDLPVQCLSSKLKETWMVDGAIAYEVDDPYKATYLAEDFDEVLKFYCERAICEYVGAQETPSAGGIETYLLARLDNMTDRFGLRVIKVSLASLSRAKRIYTGA